MKSNKMLWLMFITLMVINIYLLLDHQNPTCANAQCVKLGSSTCRVIQGQDFSALVPSPTESVPAGTSGKWMRCDETEYVRSVMYNPGRTMDSNDITVECCELML